MSSKDATGGFSSWGSYILALLLAGFFSLAYFAFGLTAVIDWFASSDPELSKKLQELSEQASDVEEFSKLVSPVLVQVSWLWFTLVGALITFLPCGIFLGYRRASHWIPGLIILSMHLWHLSPISWSSRLISLGVQLEPFHLAELVLITIFEFIVCYGFFLLLFHVRNKKRVQKDKG